MLKKQKIKEIREMLKMRKMRKRELCRLLISIIAIIATINFLDVFVTNSLFEKFIFGIQLRRIGVLCVGGLIMGGTLLYIELFEEKKREKCGNSDNAEQLGKAKKTKELNINKYNRV